MPYTCLFEVLKLVVSNWIGDFMSQIPLQLNLYQQFEAAFKYVITIIGHNHDTEHNFEWEHYLYEELIKFNEELSKGLWIKYYSPDCFVRRISSVLFTSTWVGSRLQGKEKIIVTILSGGVLRKVKLGCSENIERGNCNQPLYHAVHMNVYAFALSEFEALRRLNTFFWHCVWNNCVCFIKRILPNRRRVERRISHRNEAMYLLLCHVMTLA